jgi:hypothetical protein
MFNKFKDTTAAREVMREDGVENFFKAIGVNPATDLTFWLISMQMDAKDYGEYKYSEFLAGCTVNGCDTIEKWIQMVPRLRDRLKNETEF